MQVESVFIPELSQRVKVLKAESKQEILDELAVLGPSISEIFYKTWVLETFIVSINIIFEHVAVENENDSNAILQLKDKLYDAVLLLNPLLDPKKLYVSPSNSITLREEDLKLVECSRWNVIEDNSNLMVLDINEYFKFVERARDFDHEIEVEEWGLFKDIWISVRKFPKSSKIELLHGFVPKSQDEVKYFVVATCIDNFQQVYKFTVTDFSSTIPYSKIISSLYSLAIKHNPFLELKVKDFKHINKTYKMCKSGINEEVNSSKQKIRKSLSEVPKKEILDLENTLLKSIFGQDEAIKAVCNAVRRAYAGIKDPRLPLGAFFFYGATSTGKTELAKVLAKSLTKSPRGLIKVPCATLVDSHSVYTLVGSPPGYVGFEDRGLFERELENSKFKVILFDEVEKGHAKLRDLVLEMLEEGQLLMANGTVVDISNCLIIFTSNIGQQEALQTLNTAGFKAQESKEDFKEKEKMLASQFSKTLNEKFKPEFLARLTGIYYFPSLKEESLRKAADLRLATYIKQLGRKHIRLQYPENFSSFITAQCEKINKNFHARDVRNYIDMVIMKQLGDFILELGLNEKMDNIINLETTGDNLNFNLIPQKIKE